MKKIITGWLALIPLSYAQAQLAPFEEWAINTGSQNFFIKSKTVTDDVNSVYICGATLNSNGNYDALVSKISSTGDHLYTYQLAGYYGSHDAAVSLYVDGSHNVYVCGFVIDSLSQGADAFVTKLNSSFVVQWSKRYNGPSSLEDISTDIRTDGSGNVYITGGTMHTTQFANVYTSKYSSSGVLQWTTIYNNNSSNLNDLGARIAGMTGSAIKISIVSQTAATTYAYGLKTYSLSTGAQTATSTLGTSGSSIEEANAIAQDALKNTYIAGAIDTGSSAGMNYCILKFDSTAALVYEQYYDANNMDDRAKGIAVDDNGYAYVTGYTTSAQGTDYTTIKLDPSGNILWSKNFNGGGNDTAVAILIHKDTTLVITGSSFNGGNMDYYTIKYDTSGTTTYWEIPYNGLYNLNESVHGLAIDTVGAIIVTGQSQNDTSLSYVTVKYIEADPYLPPDFNNEDPGGNNMDYIQNKGQLIDTGLNQVNGILFYNQNIYPNVFIFNDKCSFLSHAIDTSAYTNDTLHRIDLHFINSREDAKVYPFETTDPYYNFFLPHTLNGAVDIHGSKRLLEPNLYSKIDLHYYSNHLGIKMYFIVRPGGNPDNIIFALDSVSSSYITGSGDLVFHSILDSFVFDVPSFYQDSLGVIVNRPGGAFQATANPNEYSFDVPSYNSSYPLIIQIDRGNSAAAAAGGPIGNMDWSTFAGGTAGDGYEEIRTDRDENLLACGYSFGANFPTSPGAIVPTNVNYFYSTFSKFKRSNGDLVYSTYFGGTTTNCGNLLNIARSITSDTTGNIYVVGQTSSTNMMFVNNVGGPVLQAFNKSVLDSGGCNDLFILSTDSIGNFLRFSTYYGGSSWENPYAIRCSQNNRIIIGGYTDSDFPVTTPYLIPGAYYCSEGDGFLMELLPNGDTTWVTYFPGEVADIGFHWNNEMFFTGSVHTGFADSLPIHNPSPGNAYCDSTNNGFYEAYLASLDNNKALVWCTFLGGNSSDKAKAIACYDNDIIVVGETSSTNFPTLATGWGQYIDPDYGVQTVPQGDDAFIAKFTGSSKLLTWSTYFGGNKNETVTDVAIDQNHNFYVVGTTLSFAGPSHPDSFQVLQHGSNYYDNVLVGTDGFMAGFTSANQRFWTSYLGGNQSDYPNGITTTTSGQLFVGGITGSTVQFPLVKWNADCWYDSLLNDVNTGTYFDGFVTMLDLSTFPVGVPDNQIPQQHYTIGVYPNPNNGNFNIVFGKDYNNKVAIRLFNSIGQSVYQTSVKNVSAGNVIEVSANNLAPGMYLVAVETEDGILTSKILVK